MHRENCLCIITYHSAGLEFVYPNIDGYLTEEINFKVSPALLSKTLQNRFERAINNLSNDLSRRKSRLNSALSSALTIINKHSQGSIFFSRILNIQFDKDVAQDYNSIMNSIFSAQKLGVIIDSLVLAAADSHLMQQTCFLSGGFYMKHSDWAELLIVLQSFFLADVSIRSALSFPPQKMVDFKASCFCHKKPVEFAHMCSVCLTLLCDIPSNACPVCETPLRVVT
eukprot:gene760-809_t